MKRLTAKEEEIMRIFWKEGAMFVRELLKYYDEPKPHYNTVSTIVRGLEEKGFVGYKAYGNTYQYFALISEKQYKRSALHKVVYQYYDNSYTNVVSAFIEEEGLSVEDLKALIRQIEQGRKK
ncbi:BlaI/MecI/CopY family transcriptional regulator [Bacteroides fragilis]|uniref:BlaI/MecI/CopY family transcriptional regulator n=1 Tax=Bacteroides fragilis TaxID=817 RepID=UPI00203097A8|nr:BlaI/MecI/CopY family transcriptional regulator [Bacteroides fragilis]MCE8611534.1 BlaI/MecI/CopY family transcriptional regulator [Bacteroides fragilis]MCM0274860.1 BlaI/MecI/CopY family transcriptional regulator [Bacteroides fragilis]